MTLVIKPYDQGEKGIKVKLLSCKSIGFMDKKCIFAA